MTAQALKQQAGLNSIISSDSSSIFSSTKGTTLALLAWQIAYTALWNTEEFSTTEKEHAVKSITTIIEAETNVLKSYSNFVQRVLLARQYINTHPGTYAPIPTKWFCASNKNGFAGTQRWLAEIENTRAALPKYKQSLKAFAEAIQETITSKSASDFHYWRSYFAEQNAQGLLNLFLSTIANLQNQS
jgi:hypothetical protein